MSKWFNLTRNIARMIFWVFLLVGSISYFGILWGIILFIVFGAVWNLCLTLYKKYKNDGIDGVRDVFNIIFSTNAYLPFTVYGCYCSPQYGVDGRTNGLNPVDELDEACKVHDERMFVIDMALMEGNITKREHTEFKNREDWLFMKSVMVSRNWANGVYLIGLQVGFLFRIIFRKLLR